MLNLMKRIYRHLKVKIVRTKTFVFRNKVYRNFNHHMSFDNERAVEIPIVWEIVKTHQEKGILEVGNVLSHYFDVSHDVVDKYEKAEGVINQDIVDFKSNRKYDLIISISTLEHVGWDEEPRSHVKVLSALDNLKSLLTPGGKIIVTLPMGYNPELDKLLIAEKMQFTEMYCLKRVSSDNRWIEVGWQAIKDSKYEFPFQNANGLVIGIFKNAEREGRGR